MNQITTPKKPPDQKEASMSLTVWITWNTHILQQKRYRILTSDLDSNSSRHVHLNEHQEDILPRKRPRRRHSAREEAKSLQFGKIDWIQRDLKSATLNPAKVLLINSKHHHFVMNQIPTPKKPPDQKQSSTSLTVWITWNTHILQQKRYRILTSDLDPNSSRHGHLNEHQEDILPPEEAKSLHFGKKNIESSETSNQQHRIQRKFCWSVVNTTILSWTKSQHQRSLRARYNRPWASQSEKHKIHTFCNKQGTGY